MKQLHFQTVRNLNSKAAPGATYSGRKKRARTATKIARVRNAVDADATKEADAPAIRTSRRNGLNISKSSFNRIINLDLHYHCYKVIRAHEMQPGDEQKRQGY